MNAVVTFAVLASLLSGPKIPKATQPVPTKEATAGTLTVKMSSGFGTTHVKVESELMVSAIGELGA